MYNLIIVDDESLARKALTSLIDWDEMDINVVGSVYNGIEALRLMGKHHVDIIITDIKMPGMNGLELMRQVNENYSHVKFIVQSAYDEFHMVSDAFKLGAREYFLKSEAEKEDIIKVVLKVKKEIETEKKELDERNKINRILFTKEEEDKYDLLLDTMEGKKTGEHNSHLLRKPLQDYLSEYKKRYKDK